MVRLIGRYVICNLRTGIGVLLNSTTFQTGLNMSFLDCALVDLKVRSIDYCGLAFPRRASFYMLSVPAKSVESHSFAVRTCRDTAPICANFAPFYSFDSPGRI